MAQLIYDFLDRGESTDRWFVYNHGTREENRRIARWLVQEVDISVYMSPNWEYIYISIDDLDLVQDAA